VSAEAWTFLGVVIAGVISLVGFVGAWVTARAGRNASPYDKLDARVRYLEEQREQDFAKIEDQQTEIHGLKRRMAGVIDDRDAIVAYFVRFRDWVSKGARPPAPSIPTHLAEVIPPWVSDDGEKPTPREETHD
jgi:hypothetical protein